MENVAIKFIGHNSKGYNIPDEVLIQSRVGILRMFFKLEHFYRTMELGSSEMITVKLRLRTLRGATNDINKILKKRGYAIYTGGARWKKPINILNYA